MRGIGPKDTEGLGALFARVQLVAGAQFKSIIDCQGTTSPITQQNCPLGSGPAFGLDLERVRLLTVVASKYGKATGSPSRGRLRKGGRRAEMARAARRGRVGGRGGGGAPLEGEERRERGAHAGRREGRKQSRALERRDENAGEGAETRTSGRRGRRGQQERSGCGSADPGKSARGAGERSREFEPGGESGSGEE